MVFEKDIFVNIEKAEKFYKKITTNKKTEKRIKIAHYINTNKKAQYTFSKAINNLLEEYKYETFVGLYPDFDKNKPLEIEEIIILFRVLLEHIKKENCLSLFHLLKNLEEIARRTYASRYSYEYLGL